MARDFGATDVVTERGEAAEEQMRKLIGGTGVEPILECVGTEDSMRTAILIARPGAAIGRVGVPHYEGTPASQKAFYGNVSVGVDTRTGKFNVWYRQSADGGVTWSATERLSNQSSGAPYKNTNGFGAPYGDYSGISILSTGKSIAIFGESGPAQAAPGGNWMNRQL